jgi:competence protein ComEA
MLLVAAFVSFVFILPAVGAGEKININTATEQELSTLKQVGSKYAQRIIEYRNTYGEFKAPEDIMKVKGIGPKTFEANKGIIVVKDDDQG